MNSETLVYKTKRPIRFVTASSLFDGHDASINIMRRILQDSGAEVVHLGHNRSAEEIVEAAIQEDADGIAVSSYQGGHIEFFTYMMELLRERGALDIHVFGGGGGVIVPDEIKELEARGVSKVFSPEDGRVMGLQGMINHMLAVCDAADPVRIDPDNVRLTTRDVRTLAKLITQVEQGDEQTLQFAASQGVTDGANPPAPVVGITGTGGAGKSSLTDEVVLRFLSDFPEKKLAIVSIDPSRQRTGGALLGDRIRMNAVHNDSVYMRSLATRESQTELSKAIHDAIGLLRAAGFDLILVETSGIGQGDAAVRSIADVAVYVMTAEYGAPSQLEKIDMLDYADLVAINKFDRRGAEDALRHVQKQLQRNRKAFAQTLDEMPVYGTVASQFWDEGTTRFYLALLGVIREKRGADFQSKLESPTNPKHKRGIIPPERTHYLLDVVAIIRDYHKRVRQQSEAARAYWQVLGTMEQLSMASSPEDADVTGRLDSLKESLWSRLDEECRAILETWERKRDTYHRDELVTSVRGREIRTSLFTTSLSGTRIPKVMLPQFQDYGEIIRWSLLENVPGEFPYTAGVFALKRTEEEPRRQFAGEGTPTRTNRRFHYLSENDTAKRLSTAFDSVTLYGEDPHVRPDIYGKVGESGVSICTLDDMKKLYAGFDLCSPTTSVSMTINGPAPILLAMFLNTAIEQQLSAFRQTEGREPTKDEAMSIRKTTLSTVRGTVQADILKEDQGQNTCIFSTEFALRMMGDIQQYFIEHDVRNYYSVSISGYHIAEAGANPITQLAFTLANAFTYVEYYLSRGMQIDDFAPNLSFFFSNGMDPEYTVLGRVARRIWAIAMKYRYNANERSQKLKYHIQTSGRSLHAQEVDFNDIRTTLQALLAVYDNCNSLHTNAYDEAITTPTEDSVRRAMAIQLIIGREFGLTKNENPLQGSFIVEELTRLVEEAVLEEFLRLNDRGGVLGAMETQYQRSKIQEESLHYEHLKHSGEYPIVGVNTFLRDGAGVEDSAQKLELARATEAEKREQITNLQAFQSQHVQEVDEALERLQRAAQEGENLFAVLMDIVHVASLGQITNALYQVGGRYRRNM